MFKKKPIGAPRRNVGMVILPDTLDAILDVKRETRRHYIDANITVITCAQISTNELLCFITVNELDVCEVHEDVEIVSEDEAFHRGRYFERLEALGVRVYGILTQGRKG